LLHDLLAPSVTPEEFVETARKLYGSRWRRPLAAALGVNIATIRRWRSAAIAVPSPVALAMRLLRRRQEDDQACSSVSQYTQDPKSSRI